MERLIREHCQIDGDDLINYEGITVLCSLYIGGGLVYRRGAGI